MISQRATDAINFTDVYTDVNSVQSIKASANTDKRKALQDISTQFESMMMSMMLKSMRQANSAFSENNPLIGKQELFYRDMFDQQLSLSLGKSGAIGIAEAMYRQLEKTLPPEEAAEVNPTETADDKSILNEIRRIQATKQAEVTESATANLPSEIVPQNEVVFEEAVSEIDLWLSPNASTVVNVADITPRKYASEKVATVEGDYHFDGTPERFVEQLYPHAEKAAEVLGVNPEVLLAQAALETGWGKKLIRKNDGELSFNLFNIKATKHWNGDHVTVPTLEYRNGVAVKEHAAFRAYQNPHESFLDYVELINQNPRYQNAVQNADDPKRYVRELERAGYATDPKYAEKIINIMNSDSMKKTLSMMSTDIDLSSRG